MCLSVDIIIHYAIHMRLLAFRTSVQMKTPAYLESKGILFLSDCKKCCVNVMNLLKFTLMFISIWRFMCSYIKIYMC